jgi:hypothetical protein
MAAANKLALNVTILRDDIVASFGGLAGNPQGSSENTDTERGWFEMPIGFRADTFCLYPPREAALQLALRGVGEFD